MVTIERSIEVNVPVSLAYGELSQFEAFPRFMKGVHSVHQLDEAHLHWRAERGGREMEWDAEITEHIPEQCIAWRNTSGPRNEGRVLFESVDPGKTRIYLSMESEEASMETRAGQGGYVAQDEGDLARFKKMIESKVRANGQRDGGATHDEEQPKKTSRARAGSPITSPPAWIPPVDVVQNASQLLISADLPGVSQQDVQIEVAHGQLTIEGNRQSNRGPEPLMPPHGERKFGRFFRAIALPAGVDSQSGEARLKDGVLEITFQIAAAPDLAHRLEIRAG
jgi:HSP20 family molecular chaperone IbpA